MHIRFRNVFGKEFVGLDVDGDKPFIEIIDEINNSDSEIKRNLPIEEYLTLDLLKRSSNRPLVYSEGDDKKNIFNFFKSPNEHGLNDGAEVILSFSGKAGAGILPLNSLYYHHSDLKRYLKNNHLDL